MNLLQNKIFTVVVCLVSMAVFGLIFADKVLGIGGVASVASYFNMNNNRIANLGAPINSGDAATKSYVDSARTIILENRTSDPANAAVGQMWIRIDQ